VCLSESLVSDYQTVRFYNQEDLNLSLFQCSSNVKLYTYKHTHSHTHAYIHALYYIMLPTYRSTYIHTYIHIYIYVGIHKYIHFFPWRNSAVWAMAPPYRSFTTPHSDTLDMSPVGKGPARRRDLYIHKRQTSTRLAGFEPVIPASERP